MLPDREPSRFRALPGPCPACSPGWLERMWRLERKTPLQVRWLRRMARELAKERQGIGEQ